MIEVAEVADSSLGLVYWCIFPALDRCIGLGCSMLEQSLAVSGEYNCSRPDYLAGLCPVHLLMKLRVGHCTALVECSPSAVGLGVDFDFDFAVDSGSDSPSHPSCDGARKIGMGIVVSGYVSGGYLEDLWVAGAAD
jgi:hypothetical protein